MYVRRIEIENYGPITELEIEFPFQHDAPKPILLVGENGSGKSIVLSHIVNGLVAAKGIAYPESPDVQTGMVFKIRTPAYIKSGKEWCYTRVVFEEDLVMGELTLATTKDKFKADSLNSQFKEARKAWNQISNDEPSQLITNFGNKPDTQFRDIFAKNCVLYFPHNRFEEPAWLNEQNLKAQAKRMNVSHIEGYTSRRIINYTPLQNNQDWFFDVVYDMTTLESVVVDIRALDSSTNKVKTIQEWKGFRGSSKNLYEIASDVVRCVMRGSRGTTFGIGPRLNRRVSLIRDNKILVPNIFQLSSGETSLLNMFLSILRDFNLSESPVNGTNEIRGIVVIDEIDLHLHATHQYYVLPELIKMFPRVQFIVTTHSPLFVLGMEKILGEDAFVIYQLPDGHRINTEGFTEFGNAYEAFRSSHMFSNDVRQAVENAQQPIVYMEGRTDIKYLVRAGELLGHSAVLENISLLDGNGDNLNNTWKHVSGLSESIVARKVLVVRDCDYNKEDETKGKRYRVTIPKLDGNPLEKGIENLFSKETLEKAMEFKPAFIDVDYARPKMERGVKKEIPEEWTVNENEKTNLCDWLCDNGTAEDFRHFKVIFDRITELL